MQGWARFSLMVLAAIAALAMSLSAQQAADEAPFDIVILHGHILDGTGRHGIQGMLAFGTGILQRSATWRARRPGKR